MRLASLFGFRRRKAGRASTGAAAADRDDTQFGRREKRPEGDPPVKRSAPMGDYRAPRAMSPPLAE
jgi:hypothetical protein